MKNTKMRNIYLMGLSALIYLIICPANACAQSSWAHLYGSSSYYGSGESIIQTVDGGYLAIGYTNVVKGGIRDILIQKLDGAGNIIWQKTYGGSNNDYAQSIRRTSDEGFVVAGYTNSFGAGGDDIWVLKLDSSGNVSWQKTYGGSNDDNAYSIQQTSDGGYIVAGYTMSFQMDIVDMLVLKIDALGNLIWQKTLGGAYPAAPDAANSIQQTSDGGYIVAGYTNSFGAGGLDAWILRLDATGNVIWQKTYGGSNSDGANSIQQTSDGGYIVAGYTNSFGAGNSDFWILKLDSSGNVTWQKTYGGSNSDVANSIQQTSDGGYIVAGSTKSFGAGSNDCLVMRLDTSGNILWQKTYGGLGYDICSSIEQSSDGGFAIAGYTESFGISGSEIWVFKLYPDGTMPSSCTFISDSSINPVTSSATSVDTNAVISSPSFATTNTGISGANFAAYDTLMCSSCPAPNGLMNNTASDLNSCADTGVQITWEQDPADWNDGGIGTRSYMVFRDGNALISNLSYGVTAYIDTSVTNGIWYTYKVRYTNGCGAGAETTGASATDYPIPPTVMYTIAVDKSPLDTGVQISWPVPTNWGDNGANASNRGFRVYRDSTDISGLLPASILTYDDTSGANNTIYMYHTDAINGCGVAASYNGMSASDDVLSSNWAHLYGGSNYDHIYSAKLTGDGGFIAAGRTNSFGAGNYDFWILKLDFSGSILWQKSYGGPNDDYAQSIQQTNDGGYIVAGQTYSFGAANSDIWILKLDSSGNILWQKTFGGPNDDYAQSIQQTSDTGYIVAGYSNSFGAGYYDFLILKLDSSGNVLWQKTYGGPYNDYAQSMQQTSDGGYIAAGYTDSFGTGYYDIWLLKLDASGNIIWQKTYGGFDYEAVTFIQQTSDGGYITAGYTWSFGAGESDVWILKLDASGNVTWQKTYGGASYDYAQSMQQTSEGGYIVAGYSSSFSDSNDFWILKLDASGNITWQKTYGGSGQDYAYSIQQTGDGNYLVAGYTYSFGAGSSDFWLLKFNPDGTMNSSCNFINNTYINPANSSAISSNTNADISSPSISMNNFGISGIISTATDTLICTSCPAPTGLNNNTATDPNGCSYTGVQIGWNADPANWGDGGSGVRTYAVLRDGITIVASLAYGTTTYIDATGTNGQTYVYRVTYINGCGMSAITVGVQGTDYPKPPTVMNTVAYDKSPLLDTGVEISWPVPTDWGDNGANANSREFRVYRDSTNISGLLSASTLTYEDTTGVNNIYYTYHTDVINGCGLISSNNGMAAADLVALIPDWARAYGSSNWDYAQSIQQTSDGGYIVAGYTDSFGVGSYDFWILKLDPSGNVIWQNTYGGAGDDYAQSIQQTNDGGYIVAGETYSLGAGESDFWILKLDVSGNVTWQKTYGGSGADYAQSIQQTSEGGYIAAGYTDSFGAGGSDFLILKLDASGNVIWQKSYGGINNDYAQSIQQTSEGGYIVAGYTASFGAGSYDFLVLKLNASGNVIWQKIYGGAGYELAQSIQQTSDGGYIAAGYSDSFGAGFYDYWILKLDATGNISWQKTYGGSANDEAYSIQQISDGGYIVAGSTNSFGAGNADIWILKLDVSGNVIWQKTYDGLTNDGAYSIQQTSEGGYIVAGYTGSFGAGLNDIWVLKLYVDGTMSSSCTFINDTNINAVNSSVTSANTNASIASSFATITDTAILGLNTIATDTLVCSAFCITPNGLSNNAATDLNACVETGVQIGWNADPADWGDSGLGTRKYAVLRDGIVIGSNISYGTTTFIDTIGTNGQVYTYTIRYTNGCGNSSITSPGAQAADNGFPPAGLANNSASDLSSCADTGVQITWAQDPAYWGDGGSGSRTYAVLRNGSVIAANLSYGTIILTDTTGTNSQIYTYTVRYTNGCGFFSTTSPGAQAADNIASAPSGLANNSALDLNSCADTGVRITWTQDPANWGDSGFGTRTYAVLRNGSIIASNITYGTNTFIDTAGTNGQMYTYAVRYINGCGLFSPTSPGAQAADNTCALISLKPAIDDSSSSTHNGIIETDEAVGLIGNIQNGGIGIATNVTGTLSTTDPITITNAHAIYPDINPNASQTCTTCYSLTAPAANRPATHWDFMVTESPACSGCSPASYDFTYHVGNSFSDVPPSQLFYSYIEKLLHNNVTSGCTSSTYCPSAAVQRQAIAKFLCNAMNAHTPNSCVTAGCAGIFSDVPASNPFCSYIEAIYNTGIASGCQSSPLLFCPTSSTQRQAMAKFICNAMNVTDPSSCVPASCTGMFTDVPASNIFCPHIEALATAGIVSGCAPSLFCPAVNVLRDQMAKFLVNAFALSF